MFHLLKKLWFLLVVDGIRSFHCFDFEVFIEFFSSLLAFCPYHIGHFSLVGLGFEEHVSIIPLQTYFYYPPPNLIFVEQ